MYGTNIRILWHKMEIVRPYLPRTVFSRLERIWGKPSPTKEQLKEITKRGEAIGLHGKEITAAIDAPLANQGTTVSGRQPMYIMMVLVTVAVAIWALFIWYIMDPESFPIHTYAPGTFYGTIKPQDFSSSYPLI